jgi:hypothetical protein
LYSGEGDRLRKRRKNSFGGHVGEDRGHVPDATEQLPVLAPRIFSSSLAVTYDNARRHGYLERIRDFMCVLTNTPLSCTYSPDRLA